MEDFFLPEFLNRRPEVTGIGGGSKTAKELGFKRTTVRKRLVTVRTIGRPKKERICQFSTFEKRVTMLHMGEKGASNPGRVRWSRNKFAGNSEMNNLEKGEFKG